MEPKKDERIIIRNGSRIITPKQYERLRAELKPEYRIMTDVLIHTGLRIVEFWNLKKNRHWYHRSARVIDLPAIGACKKPKCKRTDRTIRLSDKAINALDRLFEDELDFKDRNSWRGVLIRAAGRSGLGIEGINPKMFRKTLISMLVECRKDLGIDSLEISACMGHSQDTMIDNYLGIFQKEDHSDILEFLKGWV